MTIEDNGLISRVLTQHLVPIALRRPKTLVLTFNYRGVGRSEGSQPWVGAGHAVADLEAVERWALEHLKVEEILRLVSPGCR